VAVYFLQIEFSISNLFTMVVSDNTYTKKGSLF